MLEVLISSTLLGLFFLSTTRGQDNPPTSQPVSRQEFDQMKKELADVKKQQADQQTNADPRMPRTTTSG